MFPPSTFLLDLCITHLKLILNSILTSFHLQSFSSNFPFIVPLSCLSSFESCLLSLHLIPPMSPLLAQISLSSLLPFFFNHTATHSITIHLWPHFTSISFLTTLSLAPDSFPIFSYSLEEASSLFCSPRPYFGLTVFMKASRDKPIPLFTLLLAGEGMVYLIGHTWGWETRTAPAEKPNHVALQWIVFINLGYVFS